MKAGSKEVRAAALDQFFCQPQGRHSPPGDCSLRSVPQPARSSAQGHDRSHRFLTPSPSPIGRQAGQDGNRRHAHSPSVCTSTHDGAPDIMPVLPGGRLHGAADALAGRPPAAPATGVRRRWGRPARAEIWPCADVLRRLPRRIHTQRCQPWWGPSVRGGSSKASGSQ